MTSKGVTLTAALFVGEAAEEPLAITLRIYKGYRGI